MTVDGLFLEQKAKDLPMITRVQLKHQRNPSKCYQPAKTYGDLASKILQRHFGSGLDAVEVETPVDTAESFAFKSELLSIGRDVNIFAVKANFFLGLRVDFNS